MTEALRDFVFGVVTVALAVWIGSCHPAHAQSRTLTVLRVAAIGTAVGDIGTTAAVLRQGGWEANPLLGGQTVAKTAVIDGATLGGTWMLERDHPTLAKVLYVAVIATRGFAVAHNGRQIR